MGMTDDESKEAPPAEAAATAAAMGYVWPTCKCIVERLQIKTITRLQLDKTE